MSTDTLIAKAQSTLSDPNFDVGKFIENINIHYKNTKIVETLSTVPSIFLSIIESGEYAFLSKNPHFIDASVFKKLRDEGYTLWSIDKPSAYGKSIGYLLILSEEKAIEYRALDVGHRKTKYTFSVITDKKEIKRVAKRCQKNGYSLDGKPVIKVVSPIDSIRAKARKYYADKFGLGKDRYNTNSKNVSEFHWTGSYIRGFGYEALQFEIVNAGKKFGRIQACLNPHYGSNNNANVLLSNCKQKVLGKGYYKKYYVEIKLPLDDEHFALKAMDWATRVISTNVDYVKKKKDLRKKIEAELATAKISADWYKAL